MMNRRHRGRHGRGRAAVLDSRGLAVVLAALADAAAYRRERALRWCGKCESSPMGACAEHVADMEEANVYDDLAAELKG